MYKLLAMPSYEIWRKKRTKQNFEPFPTEIKIHITNSIIALIGDVPGTGFDSRNLKPVPYPGLKNQFNQARISPDD